MKKYILILVVALAFVAGHSMTKGDNLADPPVGGYLFDTP